MSRMPGIIAHHSEAVDPTLIEWIRHQIDRFTGLEPDIIVLLLGVLIVAFPIGLLALTWHRRRQFEKRLQRKNGETEEAE